MKREKEKDAGILECQAFGRIEYNYTEERGDQASCIFLGLAASEINAAGSKDKKEVGIDSECANTIWLAGHWFRYKLITFLLYIRVYIWKFSFISFSLFLYS